VILCFFYLPESPTKVSFQALESSGWLEKNSNDAYRLTKRAKSDIFNLNKNWKQKGFAKKLSN
jgi:hypothetical protein